MLDGQIDSTDYIFTLAVSKNIKHVRLVTSMFADRHLRDRRLVHIACDLSFCQLGVNTLVFDNDRVKAAWCYL